MTYSTETGGESKGSVCLTACLVCPPTRKCFLCPQGVLCKSKSRQPTNSPVILPTCPLLLLHVRCKHPMFTSRYYNETYKKKERELVQHVFLLQTPVLLNIYFRSYLHFIPAKTRHLRKDPARVKFDNITSNFCAAT